MKRLAMHLLRRALRALGGRGRPRLGLGVGQSTVRAVLFVDGATVWREESALSTDAPSRDVALRDALENVIASVPRRSRRAPLTLAAVGPATSQLRCLVGLPAIGDARALAAVLRECAARYFVKNGIPLMTSGIAIENGGSPLAAAFERPEVEAIATVCHRHGLRLTAVLPAVAVIGAALDVRGPAVLHWTDGEIDAEVEHGAHGRVVAIRRRVRLVDEGDTFLAPRAMADAESSHAEAVRWADAVGAALADPSSPLAVRVDPVSEPDRRVASRRRFGLAIAAFSAGLLLVVAGPLLVDATAARSARSRLASLAAESRSAAIIERELDSVTRGLRRAAAWHAEGRSLTLFLAALTRALPESTHLRSLRLERDGGTLVALAPHGAQVLVQLEVLPQIADPRIVGSITTETVSAGQGAAATTPHGPAPLERVTVRFRWRDATTSHSKLDAGHAHRARP